MQAVALKFNSTKSETYRLIVNLVSNVLKVTNEATEVVSYGDMSKEDLDAARLHGCMVYGSAILGAALMMTLELQGSDCDVQVTMAEARAWQEKARRLIDPENKLTVREAFTAFLEWLEAPRRDN
jgi:hypothetical protein